MFPEPPPSSRRRGEGRGGRRGDRDRALRAQLPDVRGQRDGAPRDQDGEAAADGE